MTKEVYRIAIIGSGPGGLSATAHAAEMGVSHILIVGESHVSNTIFRYQKGKHVMDEPGILPLRSPLEFTASKREVVLGIGVPGEDLPVVQYTLDDPEEYEDEHIIIGGGDVGIENAIALCKHNTAYIFNRNAESFVPGEFEVALAQLNSGLK
jgi:thioredoxin reductase